MYRDLSSGYLVAEILSWYYPQDIELPLFVNASSLNVKLSNWQRLKKVTYDVLYSSIILPLVGGQIIAISTSVRLFVSLFVCLFLLTKKTQKPHVKISPNFLCMLPMAVPWSFCGSNIMHYALLILWMTSCFHIMEPVGQSQA